MRRSLLAAFVIAIVGVTAGCSGTWPFSIGAGGADDTYVLTRETLNDLGLEQFLEEKLYEKRRLKDAYLLGDHIIMETVDRWIYGVDRVTGTAVFASDLTHSCDFRGTEDEMYVYLPCRNTLVAVDKRGFKVYTKYLKYAPAGQPNQNETHIFLPCYDGAVRAFLKEKRYFAWQYTTHGVVSARPGVGSKLIYAGSTDGWVYGLSVDDLTEVWKFKTYGPILADLVYRSGDHRLYVASTDGNLYGLEDQPQGTRQRQLAWPRPYASGGAISITPLVVDDRVYVINDHRECHAVDKRTGARLWVVENVDQVLAKGELNTYLLRDGRLVVAADNKTGSIRWILDTSKAGFQFYLSNSDDDGVYMVKSSGHVQAFREKRFAIPEMAPPAAEPAGEAAPAEE
jgi:outer membrane protein assembly factor BamB